MELNLNFFLVAQVIYAAFLGGLIGLEREFADKPAGLRTHMLVGGAAALLVILGDFIVSKFGSSPFVGAVRADPIRIMEAIITGISFLGAGTIIFRSQGETIEGLTTAASILFASAIGITVALGQLGMAAVLTILVILILFGLGFVERKIDAFRNHSAHAKWKNERKE